MVDHKYFIEYPWNFKSIRSVKSPKHENIKELLGIMENSGEEKPIGYLFSSQKWEVEKIKDWLTVQDLDHDLLQESWNSLEGSQSILFSRESRYVASSALSSNGEGTPIQRFRKDIISVGEYKHPIKGWNLNVTRDRMDDWVKTFGQMKEQGVDVEVVVDHSNKAEDIKGYLVDMFVEGDDLIGVHEMVGQASIDLVNVVKNVSVLIDPQFKDGKGNDYGSAIVHSSIVQQPVVPDQGQFEAMPMSASHARGNCAEIECFYFNKETDQMIDFKKIQKALGIESELTDENATDAIITSFTGLKSANIALTTKVDTISASLKVNEPVKLDSGLQEQMGVTASDALDNLVASGRLTPSAKTKALSLFVGEKDTRNVLSLSLQEDSMPSFFSRLVEVLKENDPVALNETTKGQTQSLSRVVPDLEEELGKSEDVIKEMAELAG